MSDLNIFDAAQMAGKLKDIHDRIVRLAGTRWPAVRGKWIRAIEAKAKEEKVSDMAAAITLAKASPEAEGFVILAVAYHMASKPSNGIKRVTADGKVDCMDCGKPKELGNGISAPGEHGGLHVFCRCEHCMKKTWSKEFLPSENVGESG